MRIENLDLLVPEAPAPKDSWRWGKIDSMSPLSAVLDGEDSPTLLTDALELASLNDRVLILFTGTRAMIVGVAGGEHSQVIRVEEETKDAISDVVDRVDQIRELSSEEAQAIQDTAAGLAQAKEELASTSASLHASLEDLDQRLNVFGHETIPGLEEKIDGAVIDAKTEYAVGVSESDPPSGDWSIVQPPRVPGSFVWMRNRIFYADGTSQTSAPALLTGNTGASGTDAVLLRIDSTRGTAFKNNAISTVLNVTVFHGAHQISTLSDLHASFGPEAYVEWWWRRKDDSAFGVVSAADPRLSADGFSLTVSPADVDEQTVFQAILNT